MFEQTTYNHRYNKFILSATILLVTQRKNIYTQIVFSIVMFFGNFQYDITLQIKLVNIVNAN